MNEKSNMKMFLIVAAVVAAAFVVGWAANRKGMDAEKEVIAEECTKARDSVNKAYKKAKLKTGQAMESASERMMEKGEKLIESSN
ncbi:MAG: hypothetical protein LBB23_02870 [Rickettsiales bacterium]|jgi:hypothetical protein|nr:hypothetical protein [Rickettsiales bacterium]